MSSSNLFSTPPAAAKSTLPPPLKPRSISNISGSWKDQDGMALSIGGIKCKSCRCHVSASEIEKGLCAPCTVIAGADEILSPKMLEPEMKQAAESAGGISHEAFRAAFRKSRPVSADLILKGKSDAYVEAVGKAQQPLIEAFSALEDELDIPIIDLCSDDEDEIKPSRPEKMTMKKKIGNLTVSSMMSIDIMPLGYNANGDPLTIANLRRPMVRLKRMSEYTAKSSSGRPIKTNISPAALERMNEAARIRRGFVGVGALDTSKFVDRECKEDRRSERAVEDEDEPTQRVHSGDEAESGDES